VDKSIDQVTGNLRVERENSSEEDDDTLMRAVEKHNH
jgi:hypothetical protein